MISKMAIFSVMWTVICIGIIGIWSNLGNAEPLSGDQNRLRLYDRAAKCKIPTMEDDSDQLNGSYEEIKSELYFNSSWMTYEGCALITLEDTKSISLKDNSPALCSLLCENHQFIGLKGKLCVCLDKADIPVASFQDIIQGNNCIQSCPHENYLNVCGSSTQNYYSVYEHMLGTSGDPYTFHSCIESKKTCIPEGPLYNLDIMHSCVLANKSCDGSDKHFCKNSKNADEVLSKIMSDENFKWSCNELKDENSKSDNASIWRKLHRFLLPVKLDEDMVSTILKRNLTCRLNIYVSYQETSTSGDTTTRTSKKHMTQGLSSTEYTLQYTTHIKTTFIHDITIGSNATTANNTISEDNDDLVFSIQIGFILGSCAMVMLIAVLACCIRITKRSEENIVMATEGPLQHTIPTAALAENYSEPKDKASTSSEMGGPRFCATTPCQNTNCQKTENGEYHHLDFTLRSETTPRFADNNEYDHVRANVISVFEQPWDTATSKVNKLFSQISKSVVQKSQNMRKSIIKRRVSRSGSPKLKSRVSDYCDAWTTQLNKKQFVFDSDVDNQSDISIDVTNSTVDSNKEKPKLRKTDSAFPVLPYSERINVKSTHIYDEPDERRMSLRERLLHMISIRPLKMPFGIELDLRASRSKSKIYSVATSLDEIDESVA